MTIRYLILLILLSFFAGCSPLTTEPAAVNADIEHEHGALFNVVRDEGRVEEIISAPSKYEKSRRAILAMQGEYHVRYRFHETVPLAPGYKKHKAKDVGSWEAIIVLSDTAERIVLQHILVSEDGHPVKHWRQDWVYEAQQRFEFTQSQTWRLKKIPTSMRQGYWTQCVYDVSDAPRYCGTGEWNHKYGYPTWTSDRSWRPLPRREYTSREDYNALNVKNRHTITPSGWSHEQDNTKVLRGAEITQKLLAREHGYNEYQRISGFNFAPGYDYWTKTKAFWAEVRSQWQSRMEKDSGIKLDTSIDGWAIIMPLFMQADAVKLEQPLDVEAIGDLLDKYTLPPPNLSI